MNESQILNSVISGLMEIPLPKDGKIIGIGEFKKDIEKAYELARIIQFSDNLKDMRIAYSDFRKHIEICLHK